MSHAVHNCLNCEANLSGHYCANCGQKANSHRITFKHFVLHDVVHGVWHFDKGIPYTIKQTFTRPGLAAIDYIAGKRVRYYNIFYLILLLIGANILVVHYVHELHTTHAAAKAEGGLNPFLSHNVKLIILSLPPLLAINAWILFLKLKFNYFEHIIFAGFIMVAILCQALLINVARLLPERWEAVTDMAVYLLSILISITPVVFYYVATRKQYRSLGFSWRIILFYFLISVEIVALIALLMQLHIIPNGDFIIQP